MQKNIRLNPLFIILIILAFWQLLGGHSKLSLLLESPITFVMLIVSLVLAITVHEFCHALAADRLGDPTPRLAGRISLNPLKHLDPLGTLMIFFTSFGWGKPVEFDPYNLRHPRKDGALIAASGPISNLLMAGICAGVVWLIINFASLNQISSYALTFFYIFGTLNISLAVFNLIPIRPLDGSHIIRAFLPKSTVASFDATMRRLGTFFLLLFIFPFFGNTAPINYVLTPIINFLTGILFPVFSV